MSDNKLLQAILDGQKEIKNDIKNVGNRIDELDLKLTSRIDKLGLDLAKLSDDAPTIKEFDDLGKRVSKLENQVVNN